MEARAGEDARARCASSAAATTRSSERARAWEVGEDARCGGGLGREGTRAVGEVAARARGGAEASGTRAALVARLVLARRSVADGDVARVMWNLALRDDGGGEEMLLVSGGASAHQLDRLVTVREFVVTANRGDGRLVVEANVVDTCDVDGAFDDSLVCGPLNSAEGVANDAKGLNGKAGVCHRGVVEAVSPIIFAGESVFFQCVLRDDDGEQVPVIFNGEFLSRWQIILKQSVGAKVELRNLKKVVLFKNDPSSELRAYSAAAEFHMVSLVAREQTRSRVACACESCAAAKTVPRFEGLVTSVVANRGFVTLRGEDGREVTISFTHIPIYASAHMLLGVRVGATVVVTHAHPVWTVNDDDERVMLLLGVDLRTQIIVTSVSLYNASDEQQGMFTDEIDAKISRLSRSIKYAVEQASFVYAEAIDVWRRAFEENFKIVLGSKILTHSIVERALGVSRAESSHHSPPTLLCAIHQWGSNIQVRRDVYREIFAPTPLGGAAVDRFDAPSLKTLSDSIFERWKHENKIANACRRGSTRTEGKVVIRSAERLREREAARFIMGVLRCIYGRLYLVDDSGELELCVDSGSPRTASPAMLNKLVMIKQGEILCEGAYVGARAAELNLRDASVRLSVRADASNIVLIQNSCDDEPSRNISGQKSTTFVAAKLATRGSELVAPRFSGASIAHTIDCPTWCFTLESFENHLQTNIWVYDAEGGSKPLKGVMTNTTHKPGSRVSISFGKQNGWFCLMRSGTTYLVPVSNVQNLSALNFVADDGAGAIVYVLPPNEDEDEDEDEDAPGRAIINVRDVLVWHRVFGRAASSGGSINPSPEMVSFRCVVVSEEWFESETAPNSKFGWEPRLKVQDLETHDIVDIYCKASAFSLPVGFGLGAKVTIHRAMRYLSAASLNIYVKMNPGVTTIEVNERCAPTSEYLPWLTSLSPTTRRTIRDMFNEERERIGENFIVNRRTFVVRARVASVSMLTVRWSCPACGADAGSVMHVTVNASTGAMKRKLPAALSGCDVCAPSARGAARPGVFEVEAAVMLDDGTAQADCWLTGQAGLALTPVHVRNDLLTLVKKHGRVTARLTRSSDEERDMGAVNGGHVVRGHASNLLGGKESATVRAAISFASSLGEMMFKCRRQYKFHEEDGVKSTTDASAFSFQTTETHATIRCGDFDVTTSTMPMIRLWASSVEQIDPKEEIRLRLSQLATR